MQGQLKQQQLRFDKFDVHLSLCLGNAEYYNDEDDNTDHDNDEDDNAEYDDDGQSEGVMGGSLGTRPSAKLLPSRVAPFSFSGLFFNKVFFLGRVFFLEDKVFIFYFWAKVLLSFLVKIFVTFWKCFFLFYLWLTFFSSLLGTTNGQCFPFMFFSRFFLEMPPQKF